MHIITNNNMSVLSKLVIALGTFDGLHLGHQALLQEAIRIAKKNHMASAVFTFKQSPNAFLNPSKTQINLMSVEDKVSSIKDFGFDYLIMNDFDNTIRQMLPNKFVIDLLIRQYCMSYAVVGYNFKFGRNGVGNSEYLKELSKTEGFNINIIEPVKYNNTVVSSTLIRDVIQKGNVELAAHYLGRYYSLSGQVANGHGRGKMLGFPTANLLIENNLAVPSDGVFETLTVLANGEKYKSITNIGNNPTFYNCNRTIETHILNFNGNLYYSTIKIIFIKKMRDAIKFQTCEELKRQIESDIISLNK